MTRTLPAARPVVFEHFADADRLARWWGPKGFRVPRIDFAPRAGARYRIEMQPPEGDAFHLTGEFLELDPPTRLAFSFAWEPADPDDVETVADLSFREVDDSTTEIRFTQGPFKTEARRGLHRDGWAESLDRLHRLVTGQA
jgi:uncharacterized protein YndB with AHSA1/START domain